VGSIAANLEEVFLQGLADTAWEAEMADWNAATLDEINTVARERIDPDHLVFVVVGDLKTIEPAIRELGIGNVRIIGSGP
jgi:zinc protease